MRGHNEQATIHSKRACRRLLHAAGQGIRPASLPQRQRQGYDNSHSTSSSLMVAAALNRMPGACGQEPLPPPLPCCPCWWAAENVGVRSKPPAAAAAPMPCSPPTVGVRAGRACSPLLPAPPRLAASREASTSGGASCTRASRTSKDAARLACDKGRRHQGPPLLSLAVGRKPRHRGGSPGATPTADNLVVCIAILSADMQTTHPKMDWKMVPGKQVPLTCSCRKSRRSGSPCVPCRRASSRGASVTLRRCWLHGVG